MRYCPFLGASRQLLSHAPAVGQKFTSLQQRHSAVGVVLNYSPERTSDPANLPISLDAIKDYLRVSDNDDDAELDSMLRAAVDRVETDTRRSLITQTWTRIYNEWPTFPIPLWRPPVASITITYLDTADASQTYAAGNYTLGTTPNNPYVALKSSSSLPALSNEVENVTIATVCGFGATEANVPHRYKQAIQLLCKSMYDGCELSPAYDAIVSQLRFRSYP